MKKHPLEQRWNTTAWDILCAIEHGFRAQVDVKGKLAEWYLFQKLQELEKKGLVQKLEWPDKDGVPDFSLLFRGRTIRLECKNVRSPRQPEAARGAAAKVELQKTRNSKDGELTRGHRTGEFEVLAACMFNQTGNWEFLFIATRKLAMRPEPFTDFLQIMQRVPLLPEGY